MIGDPADPSATADDRQERPAPMTWWPARQRIAGAAVLIAAVTGMAASGPGTSVPQQLGGGAYVVFAIAAAIFPPMIAALVILGLVMIGSLMTGPAPPGPLMLLPLIFSIIATAELLAVAGRLESPIEREPRDDLRRAGLATVIGTAVFGAVALIGTIPGPGGLLAILLASAACIVLAILLMR
jgi:hypothetical protein